MNTTPETIPAAKSLLTRLTIIAVLFVMLQSVLLALRAGESTLGRHLAVSTLNGGDAEFVTYQSWNAIQGTPFLLVNVAFLICCAAFLIRPTKRFIASLSAASVMLFSVGCVKPYKTPEFVEIKNNETAFVVPLEGDTKDQAKFQSEEFLKSKKIAAKRIEIEKRWQQFGRWDNDGQWIPTIRVIVVDRSPVTREWKTPDSIPAGKRHVQNDTAIWIESADSVGFSMGFNCTAFIKEEDAARFLYMYAGNALGVVMDSEIRGRVQQVAAEQAAKWPLDALRGKKQDVIDAIKSDIVPFYNERGITITSIGMFGGMTYENPAIQEAIDRVFVDQQLKASNLAKFEAQANENQRVVSEAQARAEAVQKEAEGRSQALGIEAEGKAKAIKLETEALLQAQQNPVYLEIKRLDMTQKFVEKWSGSFPQYYIGGPSNAAQLLSLPSIAPTRIP